MDNVIKDTAVGSLKWFLEDIFGEALDTVPERAQLLADIVCYELLAEPRSWEDADEEDFQSLVQELKEILRGVRSGKGPFTGEVTTLGAVVAEMQKENNTGKGEVDVKGQPEKPVTPSNVQSKQGGPPDLS